MNEAIRAVVLFQRAAALPGVAEKVVEARFELVFPYDQLEKDAFFNPALVLAIPARRPVPSRRRRV